MIIEVKDLKKTFIQGVLRRRVEAVKGVSFQVNENEISGETQRRAGKLKADLQYARIDEILSTGLHAFLTQFLDRVNELGGRISQDFLVPSH